jgi:DNA-binding transcriptional MerR regulator
MTTYTIGELARAADVTVRTIRYYIALGLLPPPDAAGPAASYGEEHRERLELIRRLKAERLSLEEIRALLERLDQDAVRDLLAESPPPPPDSAKAYLQRVLGETDAPSTSLHERVARRALSAAPPSFARQVAESPAPYAPGRGVEAVPEEEWRRYHLHPDLELHVRQPVRDARLGERLAPLLEAMRRLIARELHQEEQDDDEP